MTQACGKWSSKGRRNRSPGATSSALKSQIGWKWENVVTLRHRCFGAILLLFLQIFLFRCKEAINGVLMGEEPKAWYFSFVTQDTKSKVTPTFWQLARMCWHSWMERCSSRSWADQWVKVYTSYSLTGHPGTWVFAAYKLRTARTHIVEHKLQSWQSDFMQ